MDSKFISYEDAEPILTEYTRDEAMRILLKKHNYNDELIEMAATQVIEFMADCQFPLINYGAYVSMVLNIEMLVEEQHRYQTIPN